jgi:hypothetical protein
MGNYFLVAGYVLETKQQNGQNLIEKQLRVVISSCSCIMSKQMGKPSNPNGQT